MREQLNARSSLAPMRANVAVSNRTMIDMACDLVFASNLAARLAQNGLAAENTGAMGTTGLASASSGLQ